jgi:hypothetical protein
MSEYSQSLSRACDVCGSDVRMPTPTRLAAGWAGKHYRTLEGFPKLPAGLELKQKD